MNIERNRINVGAYYTLQIDMRDGNSKIIRYHTDYELALHDAAYKFSPNQGYVYVVVEVQAVVSGQGDPCVLTKLTQKLE